MMMARLLVYVYRVYTCTIVTAQAFNYARASRRTAGRPDHFKTVSRHFGAETKSTYNTPAVYVLAENGNPSLQR